MVTDRVKRVDVEIQDPLTDLRPTCEVHVGNLKAGPVDEKVCHDHHNIPGAKYEVCASFSQVMIKALRMKRNLRQDPNETAASLTRVCTQGIIVF